MCAVGDEERAKLLVLACWAQLLFSPSYLALWQEAAFFHWPDLTHVYFMFLLLVFQLEKGRQKTNPVLSLSDVIWGGHFSCVSQPSGRPLKTVCFPLIVVLSWVVAHVWYPFYKGNYLSTKKHANLWQFTTVTHLPVKFLQQYACLSADLLLVLNFPIYQNHTVVFWFTLNLEVLRDWEEPIYDFPPLLGVYNSRNACLWLPHLNLFWDRWSRKGGYCEHSGTPAGEEKLNWFPQALQDKGWE